MGASSSSYCLRSATAPLASGLGGGAGCTSRKAEVGVRTQLFEVRPAQLFWPPPSRGSGSDLRQRQTLQYPPALMQKSTFFSFWGLTQRRQEAGTSHKAAKPERQVASGRFQGLWIPGCCSNLLYYYYFPNWRINGFWALSLSF